MKNATSQVLLTDHPWPGVDIEQGILSKAGLALVEPTRGGGFAETLALARHSAAILTCWAPVPREMIDDSQDLRLVARLGVGVDNIDLAAARERGVVVTNVPDYCIDEVSDHVVALAHAWARGVVFYDRDVHAGRWEPTSRMLRRVSDLTVGVMGLGRIGRRVTEKFHALGCNVIGFDAGPLAVPEFVEMVDSTDLARRCDVVTLHLPLTPQTRHLVGASFLAQMRTNSLLVNTSRGPIIDTHDLIDALAAGRPGAAALDVLEAEPSVPPQLLTLPNVILTPHVAFFSDHSVDELRRRASEEVVRVLRGEPPRNRVI
jgi:D-3-phosphoglycerate dehydrogenase